MLPVAALLVAAPAGAVVPGFAGNVTGGGNATPIVVSTLSAAQTAVNNYSGSGGLVLHYTAPSTKRRSLQTFAVNGASLHRSCRSAARTTSASSA